MTKINIPKTLKKDALKYLNYKIDLRNPQIKKFITEQNGLEKLQEQLNARPEYKKVINKRQAQKRYTNKKNIKTIDRRKKQDFFISYSYDKETVYDKEGYEEYTEEVKINNFITLKNIKYNQIEKEIAEEIENEIAEEIQRIYIKKVSGTNINFTVSPVASISSTANIKMWMSETYELQDNNPQKWNKHEGKCVFNYLKSLWGNEKGLIKLFKTDEIINSYFDDGDCINEGVSINNIDTLCKKLNLTYYAFNAFNELISYYESILKTNSNNNHKPLVFKILNNHIHPYDGENRNSIIKGALTCIKSNYFNNIIKNEEEEENKPKKTKNNIILEKETDIKSFMINMIKKNKNILPKNIKLNSENNIISFDYYNNVYQLENKDAVYIKEIYNNFYQLLSDEEKNNYSPIYINQPLTTIINMIKKITNKNFLIGVSNKITYDLLNDAKKGRIKKGLINVNNTIDNKCFSYDINKCYSSILLNPLEDWILPTFNSLPIEYKGNQKEKIPIGLYYIYTMDKTFFNGENWYSSASLNYALKNNIDFKIKYELSNITTEPKDYFNDIIELVRKNTNENFKLLLNAITGNLGISKGHQSKTAITNNPEEMYSYIKYNENIKTPIAKPLKHFINEEKEEKETDLIIFGNKCEQRLNEISLIAYIQILDQSNIKVHQYTTQLLKETKGTLIAINTDCITIKGKKINIEENKEWGALRNCENPNINNEMIIKTNNYNYKPYKWNIHENIKSSNDYNEIINIIDNSNGIMINGDAGTGKSYLIKKIKEIKGERCEILAFTNKASLNVNGKTIHSFLSISNDNKIKTEQLKKKLFNIDIIIIDEISMVSAFLWNFISLIKEIKPTLKFVFVGDDKQLPPVEEYKNIDYFNHGVIMDLVDNNKIILSVIHRYNLKLKELSNNVDNTDYIYKNLKPFNQKETLKNLCYTNQTRKNINKLINESELLKITSPIIYKKNDNIKDDIKQDIYIYEGLPVIAYKTKREKNKDGLKWFNNETFNVIKVDNNKGLITISTIRPEEGEINYIINVEIFNNYFIMAYCITVHKSQGDTIEEKFNIYEYEKMSKKMRYTAITRATEINNIGIFA